ncbi:MAG: DUF4157 domain-containing protein [Desulfobacterales bacterium]|nr:MAG: DUF4157 domain-containing protein [Desulfobacterales bacterium]
MDSQRPHRGGTGRRAADRRKVPLSWGMVPASAGGVFPVVGQALGWHRRLVADAARLARRSEEFLRRMLGGMRIRPAADHERIQLDGAAALEFLLGAASVHEPAVSLGARPGSSDRSPLELTLAGPVDPPTSVGSSAGLASAVVFGQPLVGSARWAGVSTARLFAASLMRPPGPPDARIDAAEAHRGCDRRASGPASGRFRPTVEPGRFTALSAAIRFPGSLIRETGPSSWISVLAAVHPEFQIGAAAVGAYDDLGLTPATRKGQEGTEWRQEAAGQQLARGAATADAQPRPHYAVERAAAFAAPGPQRIGARPAALIEPAPRGLLPAAGSRILAPTSWGGSGLGPRGSAPPIFGEPSVMGLQFREPAATAGDSNVPAQAGVDPQTPESVDVGPDARGSALGMILRTKVERFFPRLDLAAVRVHTDVAADRSARTLGADAFALGRDIFFRAGRFDPASAGGLALLGHELAHVRQFQEQTGPSLSANRTELERQAAATERTLAAMLATSPLLAASAATPTGPALPGGSRRVHAAQIRTPASPPPAGQGSGSSSAGASAPPATAVAAPGLQPLTAEAGRTEAAAAAAATGGAPEDIEDLSRRLLRIIERQIAVERERRGVDRWAR